MSQFDREKWDRKYREGWEDHGSQAGFLSAVESLLPRSGRALDVAGGAGRNAFWLAEHGFDVTIADISQVGLELARQRAAERQLAVHTLAIDLEAEPFPAGPWDVIVQFFFLHRELYPQFQAALAPGGLLVIAQPTLTNLESHPKPPADFLLAPGELPGLVAELEILHYTESWTEEGRHEARIVARKQ